MISGVCVIILTGLSWFCGLHGNNTFKDLIAMIFPDGSGDYFTKTFYDVYTVVGGSGVTIALLIIGIFITKNKQYRQLMVSASIPGVFNINEIVLFGLPIVLNPVFIIPFVFAPVISFLVAYFATSIGLVPMVTNTVYWTTPPIVSGYLATNSWRGAVLQLVIIIISVIIYLPFVRMFNNIQKNLYKEKVTKIADVVKECEKKNKAVDFLELPENLKRVVSDLGAALIEDVRKENIEIYYQPQMDNEEKVVSSEALLRWRAGTDFVIYPPLAIAIAKEYKISGNVTRQIVSKALRDAKEIYDRVGVYLPVSVNIDVEELIDEEFIQWVIDIVKKYNLPEKTLGLEITEQSNLVEAGDITDILNRLKKNGIVVSIDDFSMGYTSIAYLQMNQFDYVKLDGAIVKNINKNKRSREIVDSLISLGKTLGFEVIAEYVETAELQSALKDMGCSKYQGYLYSPAISLSKYIEYIKKYKA